MTFNGSSWLSMQHGMMQKSTVETIKTFSIHPYSSSSILGPLTLTPNHTPNPSNTPTPHPCLVGLSVAPLHVGPNLEKPRNRTSLLVVVCCPRIRRDDSDYIIKKFGANESDLLNGLISQNIWGLGKIQILIEKNIKRGGLTAGYHLFLLQMRKSPELQNGNKTRRTSTTTITTTCTTPRNNS